MSISFNELKSDFKKKNYQAVYFLHGLENYFIDEITQIIEKNVLSESEKAFNQTILYGKEVDHLAVVDSARRYPMMASHQVVIIKEAQEMKSLKELKTYIEKPLDSTILAICYKHKKFNFNSAFGKALKANAVVFHSKPLYDNQIPDWIQSWLKVRKLNISPEAAVLLGEYLGTELSKLNNELEKLALNLPQGTEVTAKLIEENIGISKDYNVFELQRALGQRDILKANRIVRYFASNPKKNPLPVVIGSLYNYFSKIYMYHYAKNLPEKELLSILQLRSAYFLKEYRASARFYNINRIKKAISTLRAFDLKSKGVEYNNTGKPDGELLKEMVWHLLH